jgi:peptidyl-prolyl cis-trans isomerase C
MLVRQVLICLGVFFVIFALSCRKKTAPNQTDVNQVSSQTPAQMPANGVAATVNGVQIKETQVQALMEEGLKEMSASASQLPPAFLEQYKNQLRAQALEQLIIEQLLNEKVKQANIEVSDDEVINTITKLISAGPEPLSLDQYKKMLVQYGRNFDEEKERVRKGLAYQKILDAQLAGKINVTEEDARKFYDENPKQFETAEQVRASHILIKPVFTEGGDPNEDKAAAKKKIQDLLKQIKEGADFAQVAMSNSMCPSAPKGGDLGYFSRGDMTPEFEKAAFGLAVGQISDVVETEYGFHIIKVTGHKDAGMMSFDQAKDQIIAKLTDDQKRELTGKYIESLKAEADILYPPANGT